VQEKQQKRNVKRSTVRSTQLKRSRLKTDWDRVDALTDAGTRRAIRSDPDAAPELDAAWFRRAKVVLPEPKKAVSIRLDRDVVEWFQKHGRGYQTRINAILRAYVDAQPSQ